MTTALYVMAAVLSIALPSRRLVILRIITCVRAISIFPARYAVYECLAELLAQGYPMASIMRWLAQDARKDTGAVSRNHPCPCGSGKI